jgi:uncharacterized protein YqjF (DUF2071 family)
MMLRSATINPGSPGGSSPAEAAGAASRLPSPADLARRRIVALPGDPFLLVDWDRVLFLHFLVNPEAVRRLLPPGLELDLFGGQACVSLVALTMRHFRAVRPASLGSLFQLISQQTFFNFRTYVRWGEEPGAFFLWGWLSRPFGLPPPLRVLGLAAASASMDYRHAHENGEIASRVTDGKGFSFGYRGSIEPRATFGPSEAGSLSEFALERYTGFFCRHLGMKIFRAWHPTWAQCSVDLTIQEQTLMTERFPWFESAKFAGANFAPGSNRVWLGRPHSLARAARTRMKSRHGLSSFYEMP